MNSPSMRRLFLSGLVTGLTLVWPVLSVLLAIMLVLGIVVGIIEGWPLFDALYFSFVTGLTIGYGDLAPTHPLSRLLALGIGATGIMLIGVVTAIVVRAMERAYERVSKT